MQLLENIYKNWKLNHFGSFIGVQNPDMHLRLREFCCLGELVKPKGLRNSLQELGGNLDSELKIIYLFIFIQVLLL